MNRIKRISLISFVISGGCLALGFYSVGFWLLSIAIVVFRLSFWMSNYFLNIKWSYTIVFLFDFVFLIIGNFLSVSPIFLVSGLVGSLITWDLEYYYSRLENIAIHGREMELSHKHLRRLFLAASSGGILAMLPLTFNINPGFGLVVLFSVVSVLGLVIGIQLARRSI